MRARCEACGDRPPPGPRDRQAPEQFYGVKSLDPQRVSRDADQIAAEVVKHLVAPIDANVEVKLEISAEIGRAHV